MNSLDRLYVLTIAHEKNFSRAAAKLYISQPALSAYIIKLEKGLGCRLFDRNTFPLSLTSAGRAFVDCASKEETLEKELGDYLSDLTNLEAGCFSIGGSQFFCTCFLPPILTDYARRYPKISISLVEDGYPALKAMLGEGTVDCVLDYETQKAQNLTVLPLHQEQIFLTLPPHSPRNQIFSKACLTKEQILSGYYLQPDCPKVPLSAFLEEEFLFLNQEHDLYDRSQKLCSNAGFHPKIKMFLNQTLTAFALTLADFGASFISDTVIRCGNFEKIPPVYKIDDQDACRFLSAICKKNRYVSKALQRFLDLTAEQLKE